jgi:hypothetical protein
MTDVYTTERPPPVGARVAGTIGLYNNSGGLVSQSDRGAVTEVHIDPDETTPLDEGVWGLLEAYGDEYPKWIARVVWYDNPDAPELVGPAEIRRCHD